MPIAWRVGYDSGITFDILRLAQLFISAADRNKQPIREILSSKLPERGVLLEIACGTLQHACHIAPDHPDLVWQPTDINPDAIAHGSQIERPGNLRAPVYLDVLSDEWPFEQADVVYTANLLHISPPSVSAALFQGARRLQVLDVFIYGPFIVPEQPTAEGNRQFDEDLRRRNPQWGIRSLGDVRRAAATSGFVMVDAATMPANNLCLHFRGAD